MPPKPDWLITPTEAIKALKNRVPMPIADYKNLDARIHDQALTSSGVTQASFLQDMHWLLTNALERGEGLDVFMDQWNKLLGRKGWAPGGNRIRTIFDTNIRKANADGKRARIDTPVAQKTMPYRIWRWRDSVVPRPEHKALHNKAFEADSEFYKAVHFPCDWGCKCGWFPVSADYVERNNIEIVTDPPPIDTIVGKGFRRGKGGEFDFGELIKNSLSKISPDLKKAAEKRIGENTDSLREDEDNVVNVPAKGDVAAYSYVRKGSEPKAPPVPKMTVDNQFSGKHKATIKEWIKTAGDIQVLPGVDPKTVAKAKDCLNVCEMIEPVAGSFQVLGMPTHFKGVMRDGEMVAAAVYTDSKDEVDEDELDPEYSPPGYLSLELLTASPATALPNHPLKKEKLGIAAMREMVTESVRRGHGGRIKLSAIPGAIPFYTSVGFKPEGEMKAGKALQPMVLEKAEARAFLVLTLEKRKAFATAIALAPLLAAERAAYPVFVKPKAGPPAE